MLNDYDPISNLRHYPMPMERFGKNPYGENLYRIIFGKTRCSLIVGDWNKNGMPVGRWKPTYPHLQNQWILEKWRSAFEFTGCTAAQWNADANCTVLGPYPDRGEYQMVGQEGFNPEQVNIEKLIQLVEAGNQRSWREKLDACRKSAWIEECGQKSLREAIIRDCLPAFGVDPMVGYGGGRGTKTSPVLRSANELGLPINNSPKVLSKEEEERFLSAA
jgi:hypothetical protein